MKYSKNLAMCALMLPVGAFTANAAFADQAGSAGMHGEHGAKSSERSSASESRQQGSPGLQGNQAASASDRRAQTPGNAQANYMTSMPDGAVRTDKVVGSKLHTRADKKDIGKISDLLMDESGQILAVVVDVGGIMGMGQRSVAVSWDSIERTTNEDRDGYDFSVNATEEALREAPAYDKDSTGIRARTSSTN